jgi:riboflavin kinase/FMN adenylyltransferase
MKHLVVGEDFAFGRGRQGDTAWLKKESAKAGTGITVVKPLKLGGRVVSSSLIRDLLKSGDLALANSLLGRPYHFDGVPEKGRGFGRKMGVPTVNLAVPGEKILPAGVYAAFAGVEGREWPAVINIGIRPTFFSEGKTVPEIFILGFSGRWPDKKTGVYLCLKLRDEKKFDNVGELKAGIARDVVKAKKYFGMA